MTEQLDNRFSEASIADKLCELGKLDQEALDRVWRWSGENRQSLVEVIPSLGIMPEREMAEHLASFLDLPLATPNDYPTGIETQTDLGERFLKDSRAVPLNESDETISLAMVNPLDDFARRAVQLKSGKSIALYIAVPSELEQALDRLYVDQNSHLDEIVEDISDDREFDDDAERLRDMASEAPVIRLVNLIINRAVELRASDIHIEPYENQLRVRYRIDGILHEAESPSARLRFAIISRLKIMAKLNIAERRLPQDGRIKLVVRGNEIDLRVSCIPTMYGESVVLRILDKMSGIMGLSEIGFDETALRGYRDSLDRPNGIILVTGPTGSGKTTTLYGSLLHLNEIERNIITVEDPIEYRIGGINQIQVKPQIGLSFAHALRSILRHDPDIVMVGEIRDVETAEIAIQAALTGHLVLSTLHTNSAVITINRLLEMGIADYLLTSTLVSVLAQRLVRKLCPHCKEPYEALPDLVKQLHIYRLTNEPTVELYRPKGCEECGGTGYLGRTPIAEFLPLSDPIQTQILKHADSQTVQSCAIEHGMTTMYEDGLRKVMAGETTTDEILRVTREQ